MKVGLLFILFMLFSCKENEVRESSTIDKSIKEKLFLDFSPKMNDAEFWQLVEKYNGEQVLKAGYFIVKVDTIDLKFKIASTENAVELKYVESELNLSKIAAIEDTNENHLIPELDHSKFHKSRYRQIVTNLKSILERKYDNHFAFGQKGILKTHTYYGEGKQITSILNKQYGTENGSFYIFKSNDTIALLAYSMNGKGIYRVPSVFALSNKAYQLSDGNLMNTSKKEAELLKTTKLRWYDINMTNNLDAIAVDNELKYVSAFDDILNLEFSLDLVLRYYTLEDFNKIAIEAEETNQKLETEKTNLQKQNQKINSNYEKNREHL